MASNNISWLALVTGVPYPRRSVHTGCFKKSSPPPVKSFCMKFWKSVVNSYPHISTNFCRFMLIFHKMALIFPRVPIVFNLLSFGEGGYFSETPCSGGAHLPNINCRARRWINYYCLWRMARVPCRTWDYLPSLNWYSLCLPIQALTVPGVEQWW